MNERHPDEENLTVKDACVFIVVILFLLGVTIAYASGVIK